MIFDNMGALDIKAVVCRLSVNGESTLSSDEHDDGLLWIWNASTLGYARWASAVGWDRWDRGWRNPWIER